MKTKVLIAFLFLIFLILTVAVAAEVTYDKVDANSVPVVSVNVFGVTIEPAGYSWHAAVFQGLIYKEILSENQNVAIDLGELEDTSAAFVMPDGYDAAYELLCDGELISAGEMEQWHEELYGEQGNYELLISLSRSKETAKGYGSFSFRVKFTILHPEFFTGKLSLVQGEVFVMKLANVPLNIKPAATTDLGLSIFTPTEDGGWFAAIPVGNTRPPGRYTVTVNAGKFEWETELSVSSYAFDTQNLIVDTSNPTIIEANSPKAYQQYREKIPPLFETYDGQIYWEGTYIRPVSGRISTQFGVIRYTNSNWSNPRYHWGIDIAADIGVPVNAPNHGRVVLAEYLLNTGNTAVIEHGGGLKSYYFHMDSLNINEGDMVQKGERIGTVGSTGYSTGPHLHFEMRIGNQAVNPIMLFESSASLYELD